MRINRVWSRAGNENAAAKRVLAQRVRLRRTKAQADRQPSPYIRVNGGGSIWTDDGLPGQGIGNNGLPRTTGTRFQVLRLEG